MIALRPSAERGQADHGWLQARHSFSFADYHDPAHMSWGVLRVINEDRIAPAAGFGMHGHRDMEIVTWILSGQLAHQDSLGHGGVIRRGEVQRMSAGHGIRHSEVNPADDTETHLLQIWIEPAQHGVPPSYEQQMLPLEDRRGEWLLVASPDGAQGSTTIHQDARILACHLIGGGRQAYTLGARRLGWIQVVHGRLVVNGISLVAGDGAGLVDESELRFGADEETEFLLFDLPPAA